MSVWALDFEFQQPDGETPYPLCLVARDLNSGRLLRVWEPEQSPFPPDSEDLFIAYYSSA
jgi:hypothetical protein